MTSAKFKSVPVSSIIVERSIRQRRELTGLEELAESIRNVGLINPPVVTPELKLVAGERRFTAIRDHLGWTHIPVQFTDDLPFEELHLIELEENVKRVDLTWQDECLAIEEYHKLRKSIDQDWTASKTAEALGIADTVVSRKIDVAEHLRTGDEMVNTADKYSIALGIVERRKSRQKESAGDAMDKMLGKPSVATEDADILAAASIPLEDGLEEELAKALASAPRRVPFLHEDFNEFTVNYSGPKFNFLHCDFPYGIDAGKHNQGAAKSFGGYDDSEDVYWKLLDTLHLAMDTLVAPSAHLMFWFSMKFYSETLVRLQDMGWVVNPMPLIWFKSDNSGILPDPKRGPRQNYETAFLASRGDRMIVRAKSNVAAFPNVKSIHMSEKNPEMLRHFFSMLVDDTTTLLDPTMGSGNAVIVAEEMGAKYSLGLERDETFFENAKENYLSRLLPEAE